MEAHGYVCDVTDEDAVQAMVKQIAQEVGVIDILVNNAGIIKRIPMCEMTAAQFRQVVDVDLNAPFIVSKAVLPGMIEKGHGKIINICSMMSELGRETVSAYAAAKGGLKMLTKNIASEYGEYNIQCNGIGPGYIETPQTAPLRERQADGSRHPFDQFIIAKTPAARWGTTEDLVGPAVFLASDASNFVNGHVLYVDGGILACIGKQPKYLITAETVSPHLADLQIVDEETKRLTISLVQQRQRINDEKRKVSWTNRGHSMLGGNLYCGCCGKRLASILKKDHYTRADGSVREIVEPRYICYHATRKLNGCTGQQTYQAERVDQAVTEVAHLIFQSIKETPREASIALRMQNKVVQLLMAKKDAASKMDKTKRELDILSEEISKCLLGESRFSDEELSRMIDKKKQELKEAQKQVHEIAQEAESQEKIIVSLSQYYDQFTSWADEFDIAPMERKRMILSELFSRIELSRGYRIKIEVELNYRQFLEDVAPNIQLAV